MFRCSSYRSIIVLGVLIVFVVSMIVGTGCTRYKKFTDQRLKSLEQATNEMRQEETTRAIPSGSADVPTQPGCHLDRGNGWEPLRELRKDPQVCNSYRSSGSNWSGDDASNFKAGFIPVKRVPTVRVAQRFTPSQLLQTYSLANHNGDPLFGYELNFHDGTFFSLDLKSTLSGADQSNYSQGYTLFVYDFTGAEASIFLINPTFEEGIIISLE